MLTAGRVHLSQGQALPGWPAINAPWCIKVHKGPAIYPAGDNTEGHPSSIAPQGRPRGASCPAPTSAHGAAPRELPQTPMMSAPSLSRLPGVPLTLHSPLHISISPPLSFTHPTPHTMAFLSLKQFCLQYLLHTDKKIEQADECLCAPTPLYHISAHVTHSQTTLGFFKEGNITESAEASRAPASNPRPPSGSSIIHLVFFLHVYVLKLLIPIHASVNNMWHDVL